MFGLQDDSVFERFEKEELKDPSPRKVLDDRTIYISRDSQPPKEWGAPVLCDLGSAVCGSAEHTEDIQPEIYRAPEVILEIPWSYEVDIWNAGCMVWDLLEGGHLFTGRDPAEQQYRSRTNLAEMIALLGPPPPELLAKGKLSRMFLADDGTLRDGVPLPQTRSLGERETTLVGSDERDLFLDVMRKMLQWDPSKRYTAKTLAEDPWIRRYL